MECAALGVYNMVDNRPFAARGHVLGYHLATRNWRASVPVEQKPEGQARVVLKKSF